VLGLLLACWSLAALATAAAPLVVAVSEPDIAAIVRDVGGNQVETSVLFKGCILRRQLQVEQTVRQSLLKADAVVWTGFLPEAGAVRLAVGDRPERHGDPFFRLNPENGAVMARNVAEGLAKLRPEEKAYFEGNAEAFRNALAADIVRWKAELQALAGVRVLCTQCGWENFAKLGGPELIVCKKAPGCPMTPEAIAKHVKQVSAQIILLDPHTIARVAKALREVPGVVVAEAPSSIGDLPGATSYAAIFDNVIQVLRRYAAK
jgi:ABC-type Zn uptake system ZnuABC Zn-binding protein ZnuA